MDYKIKMTGFSGNPKEWERWSKTFMAKAKLRSYREVLTGQEQITKDGKNYEIFKDKNDIAFAELLICCENDLCFQIVENSRSDVFPEGDACLAWSSLVSRFEPKTKFNLIKLKKELMESKLEDLNKDPEEWIMELEIICRKIKNLGQVVNEEDLMLMIFQNLPPEYENTVEILEIEFENGETDLQKVKERLNNRFNKLEKNKKIIENEKELNANEKALAMKQGGFN